MEFWIKANVGVTNSNGEMGILSMQDNTGAYSNIEIWQYGLLRVRNTGTGGGGLGIANIALNDGTAKHVVIRVNAGVWTINVNGIGYAGSLSTSATAPTALWKGGNVVNAFYIGLCNFGQTLAWKIDEFRFYNRTMTTAEINANYNLGVGENPQNVVGLGLWYKFDQFENLDFSSLQNNSDIRLAVRDLSNNFRHGQPLNCDTNIASANYVLKTF
jgi:hypothetical protein